MTKGDDTTCGRSCIAQANRNIFVDNYSKTDQYDCIQTDFERKTAEILQVLYDKGHRRIAFIGGYSSIVDEDGSVVHKRNPRQFLWKLDEIKVDWKNTPRFIKEVGNQRQA